MIKKIGLKLSSQKPVFKMKLDGTVLFYCQYISNIIHLHLGQQFYYLLCKLVKKKRNKSEIGI